MHVAALLLLALISARGYANAHAAEADSSVKEVYIWGQQPTSAATEQTRWQRDLQLNAVKQARFEPAENDGKNVPAEFTYVYRLQLRNRQGLR